MIRVLAFVISICCCIGLISGTYTAISQTQNDVAFTETVHLGDPAILDGRSTAFALRCGEHMLWETEYRFGSPDSHRTEFTFSQEEIPEADLQTQQVLAVYEHTGWGMSTSGGTISLDNSDYATLLKSVMAMAAPGERVVMRVKLKDYVSYHALNFDLNYASDQYICSEFVDPFNILTGGDVSFDSECYEAFCSLFRFPVLEDQIVSVAVWRNEAGGLTSIDFNCENDLRINVIATATDEGVYCVPVYLSEWYAAEAIPGEYAQGMGIYFIPWKAASAPVHWDERQTVTLDVEKAENIYPLEDTTVVFSMEMDPETGHLWMLGMENKSIFLTKIDLKDNRVLTRLELAQDPDAKYADAQWCIRDDLILVHLGSRIALVTDGATPKVEFIVSCIQADEDIGFFFSSETGAMLYEDGLLYLADLSPYNGTFCVMVFGPSGPVYYGTYTSSLAQDNHYGYYLRSHHQITGLE